MSAPAPPAVGKRTLLVEDDAETCRFIAGELEAAGYTVTAVAHGRAGLLQAGTAEFDVLVIDRMLPRLDGLSLVTALRCMGITVPIIFLTALSRVDERVEGLRAGGDDYLIKPFAVAELLARIEAIGRRGPLNPQAALLRVGDLALDRLRWRATRGDRRIDLQPREFRLLEYLMLHAGKTLTRTMLLEAVWDFHFDPRTSLVESHISRLRAKVDRGFDRPLIHTVWGVGYRMSDGR